MVQKSVVVTGGSGKAGSAIIKDLIAHGYAVMNVDVVPPREQLCHFYKADLTDAGQATDAIRRAAGTIDRRRSPLGDAQYVVHMAGIPAPSLAPDAVTFQNNLMSTYNVFSAATLFGIKAVVWASSETVFGLPLTRSPPIAAPLTEEHPAMPESGYALAKLQCEQMAREMHRWNPGTRFLGLRISNIFEPADYAAIPSFGADINIRKWNLWSWVDARDVAQACRLGLEIDVVKVGGAGADVFTVAAADTLMPQTNRELMAQAFPGVPLAAVAGGHETLLSIAKARRLLGYKPDYGWRV
jgi:nucleoside-diphosphate-sugar epimerase